MTSLVAWLEARRLEAPADLARRLMEVGPAADGEEVSPREGAVAAATEELRRTLGQSGRVRDSAFSLLVADAWITYACEAALSEDDPIAALHAIANRVGRVR